MAVPLPKQVQDLLLQRRELFINPIPLLLGNGNLAGAWLPGGDRHCLVGRRTIQGMFPIYIPSLRSQAAPRGIRNFLVSHVDQEADQVFRVLEGVVAGSESKKGAPNGLGEVAGI